MLTLVDLGTHAHAAAALDVVIEGVPLTITDKLVAALDINRERGKASLDAQQLKTLHRRASRQIKTALQSFGYYKSEVQASLSHIDERWTARYDVTLGPPLRYQYIETDISGDGNSEPKLLALFETFPIRKNYIVDHTVYESAKRELIATAIELAYLDARFNRHEILVDLERNEAQLTLHLETGALFYFGNINFDQGELDREFLERYGRIKPGQRYSTKRLIALENALQNSGYFVDVAVTPRIDDAENHRVPIDVVLDAIKPSRFTFGLGYGTDTGARGKFGWEKRRVNRRGHRFISGLTLSQTSEEASARYIIPIRNPRNDRFSTFGTYLNDNPDTSESELGRIGISRSSVHGKTSVEYMLNFQHETFTVAGQQDTVDFLAPSVNLSWITADDRLFPTRGLRADISMVLAYDGILSNISFAQTYLRGKLLFPIGSHGRLILRGEAGVTFASDVTVLPASIRFFAGGDQSVRGFAYEELGPEDDDGNVIGGRYMIIGSAEYEHRITSAWSVSAFLDAGNAFDDFDEDLEQGVGVGVRWRSPVGPIRLDIANAVSKKGKPWRLHFTIGPDL